MIIDCVADLHGFKPKLQGGDLLIVAGDLTARDEIDQYSEFFEWFTCQNYSNKILVAGNHDNEITKGLDFSFSDERIHYLEDSELEIEYEQEIEEEHKFKGLISYKVKKKLKIWGSPYTPLFDGVHPKCKAFMLSISDLQKKVALIPEDIDILITHGPAMKINDKTIEGEHVGCVHLNRAIKKIQPILHVCGHIHEGYGIDYLNKTISVNASHVDWRYRPVNEPIRIIIDANRKAQVGRFTEG